MSIGKKYIQSQKTKNSKNTAILKIKEPIQDYKYSFFKRSSAKQNIIHAIYNEYINPLYRKSPEIGIEFHYIHASWTTVAEFLNICRNHILYKEWFGEFESTIANNGGIIKSVISDEENCIVIDIDWEPNIEYSSTIYQTEYDFVNAADEIFDALQIKIEEYFNDNPPTPSIELSIFLEDFPLEGNTAFSALADSPDTTEQFNRFLTWLEENDLCCDVQYEIQPWSDTYLITVTVKT